MNDPTLFAAGALFTQDYLSEGITNSANYTSIDVVGDIFALPKTREAFKEQLAKAYPNTKAGAIPVDAGTLYKFAHEIEAGDFII